MGGLPWFEQHQEIQLLSPTDGGRFCTPVTNSTGKDSIFVSRIRHDIDAPQTVSLWATVDNVRKNAAFNTIHIAEELIKTCL